MDTDGGPFEFYQQKLYLIDLQLKSLLLFGEYQNFIQIVSLKIALKVAIFNLNF